MEKITTIDQIEIAASGVIHVRFVKQILEGRRVLAQEYHRTDILPGMDVNDKMASVNLHLEAMGYAQVRDYAALASHVALAHTEEVVAAFKAAQEKKE